MEFATAAAIVKASPRPRESQFYRDIAPGLREHSIALPRIYAAAEYAGHHWLVREHLAPLPWHPEATPAPAVLENLARLHAATRAAPPPMEPIQPGVWLPGRTGRALSLFDSATADALRQPLAALEAHAPRLLEPWCWISGDPSPPNWGLSEGAPALFDWELFRPGTPATDLAITIPGFPSPAAMANVAARYRDVADECPWTVEEFARDMAVAKVGAVVVMLAAQADEVANVPKATIERIVATFPGWVAVLSAVLG